MAIQPSSQKQKERNELQLQCILAEYNMLRDAVANYRKMQSNLDNYALAGLGLSIPLIVSILEQQNTQAVGMIYLLPALLLIIAFTQLRYERQLEINAFYIHNELRKRAKDILDDIHKPGHPPFNYELALIDNFVLKNKARNLLAVLSRSGVSLVGSVILVAVGVILQFWVFSESIIGYHLALWVLGLGLLIGDVLIACKVVEIQRDFYRDEENIKEAQQLFQKISR